MEGRGRYGKYGAEVDVAQIVEFDTKWGKEPRKL